MEDYIKAYQTTGRPPFPVLQEPTDELQRKALNLPPLFQPQNPRTLGASSSSSPFKPPAIVTNTEKIVDPVKLPAGQEFRLHSSSDEKYATITCMPMYEGFSVEVCVFSSCRYSVDNPVLASAGTTILCLCPRKQNLTYPNHHGPFRPSRQGAHHRATLWIYPNHHTCRCIRGQIAKSLRATGI